MNDGLRANSCCASSLQPCPHCVSQSLGLLYIGVQRLFELSPHQGRVKPAAGSVDRAL